MPSFFKLNKSQQGSAGMMALLVMTILLTIGSGLIIRSSTESKISSNYTDGVSAQYLAEAGIQHAKAWLMTSNLDKLEALPIQKIDGGGTYKVEVEFQKNEGKTHIYKVTATGKVNNSTRSVKVYMTVSENQNVYDFVIYGGGKQPDLLNRGISFYPSVLIEGDIGSLKNIDTGDYAIDWVTGISNVTGNIEAVGTVNSYGIFGHTNFGKKIDENLQKQKTLPVVTYDTIGRKDLENSIQLPRGIYNTYNLDGYDYYHEGNLNLEALFTEKVIADEIKGPGTILVHGNVYLGPGTSIFGSSVLVMATGNIYIGSGITYNFEPLNKIFPARVDNAILISNKNIFINNMGNANDSLTNTLISIVSGSYPMKGSAFANGTVTMYGASKISYDKASIDNFKKYNKLPPVKKIRVIDISNWEKN